jgi:integral membrane protein
VQGALTRYRIIAWIVGVILLVLVLVGMPIKYIGDDDTVVGLVGPIHGFLFMVYVALTFDLARRAKWPFGRIDPVLLILGRAQGQPLLGHDSGAGARLREINALVWFSGISITHGKHPITMRCQILSRGPYIGTTHSTAVLILFPAPIS